jgi:hypothetical protein
VKSILVALVRREIMNVLSQLIKKKEKKKKSSSCSVSLKPSLLQLNLFFPSKRVGKEEEKVIFFLSFWIQGRTEM